MVRLTSLHTWVLLATRLISNIQVSQADGIVGIKFIRYENPEGEAANGHCCDGRWIICQRHGCDYLFSVCLDDRSDPENMDSCTLGKFESTKVKNKDNYDFGSTFGGVDNPMTFSFRGALPSLVVLKIDIYDHDVPVTDNDFVDFLRVSVPIGAHFTDPESDVTHSFIAEGTREKDRTSLRGEIIFMCDPDWYTETCGTYCKPPEDYEHHRCDPETGDKICDPGWSGSDCWISEHDQSTTTTRRTTTAWEDTSTTQRDPNIVYVNRPNADCDNLARSGYRYQDGVYTLQAGHDSLFLAYCDMSHEGWTVIQHRRRGLVSFDRGWTEYKDGFGEVGLGNEYWLGLEKIYWLTNQRPFRLRITMQIGNHEYRYANYDQFWVDSDEDKYKLHVQGYSGTAGDALSFNGHGGMRLHDGMPFSTPDQDNDKYEDGNCAELYRSGWWFNDCYWSNLNGVYRQEVNGWPECEAGVCVAWNTVDNYDGYSLIFTEMKIMPNHDLIEAGVNR